MRGFTANGGRKLGIRPIHMVLPVEPEKTATQLLECELLAEGSTTVSNEMKGKLTLLVADLLCKSAVKSGLNAPKRRVNACMSASRIYALAIAPRC